MYSWRSAADVNADQLDLGAQRGIRDLEDDPIDVEAVNASDETLGVGRVRGREREASVGRDGDEALVGRRPRATETESGQLRAHPLAAARDRERADGRGATWKTRIHRAGIWSSQHPTERGRAEFTG